MGMLEEQIISRGIKNSAVLNAFKEVDRRLFVPDSCISRAYGDYPLPIGEGQTISQPYIVAYMTEQLTPDIGDIVLEVGTGSGYQAAILSKIVKKVYSVERITSLVKNARENLLKSSINSVEILNGDGYSGWREKSPFDIIIVTAASPKIPPPLIEQLRDDGGRIIIPVDLFPGYQELVLGVKKRGELILRRLLPVRFVPFISDHLLDKKS